MKKWVGGLAHWTDHDTAYISVAFTWKLQDAYSMSIWYKSRGFRVRAGGPGLFVLKNFLDGVAEVGGNIQDAVARHNPLATIASRGCPVGCWFCIVPKMEGKSFTLIPDFPVRPILCDNNLSALPLDYQRHIISRYRDSGVPLLDANSGFEPRTFTDEVLSLWKPINRGPWRFAFDDQEERDDVIRVMKMLKNENQKKKRVYVLIGNEPVESCIDRVKSIIGWGGEPHVQPYMKLNALVRRPYVRFDWTLRKLLDVARWANRRLWKYVPLEEYRGPIKRLGNS
jgi:hypothetical protein